MRIVVVIAGVFAGWTLFAQGTVALRGEAGVQGVPGDDGPPGDDGAVGVAPYLPSGRLVSAGPPEARELVLKDSVTLVSIDADQAFVEGSLRAATSAHPSPTVTSTPSAFFPACPSAGMRVAVGCVGRSASAGIMDVYDGCLAVEQTIAAGTYYADVNAQALCMVDR